MKSIVLFSGGLDSTTLLALAIEKHGKENVKCLSLLYGQKHKKELEMSKELSKYYGVEHIVLDVSKVFESSNCSLLEKNNVDIPNGTYAEQLKDEDIVSTYVPFRNGLFLSIASVIALSFECDVIYYGAHRDDYANNAYPDCSIEFTNAMNNAIYLGSGKQVRIEAPFIKKDKAGIVEEGIKLKVPYEKTWSCYKGGEKHCGTCATCIDRKEAFKKNGHYDPTEYEV